MRERSWSLGGVAAAELFEMASRVEQGGFDFYARLTSRMADPRSRNEFRYLRDEEALHKAWFLSQLRAGGNRPRGILSEPLEQDLDIEFLRPLELAFAQDTPASASLGIGSELARKSIELYAAMQDVLEPGLRAELGRIIDDEEGHRRRLESLRALDGSGTGARVP